jgi:hypothetical protein
MITTIETLKQAYWSIREHLPIWRKRKLRSLKRHLLGRWEGEYSIKREYKTFYGKELDLANPRTFTEKLFKRKLMANRHGNPVFTRLADKYLVRDYVSEKIGADYLVDLLWHGTDPKSIPFDSLPPKCIVKTNHGSGGNIVLQDPVDRNHVVNTLHRWLKDNYYWVGHEYWYYKIKPQIVVEQFLDDGHADGPLDYRFWCFSGRPEIIQVDNHAHSINQFYDPDWNRLLLRYRDGVAEFDIHAPENLSEMLLLASKLSSDFDYVRVDLYNIKGKIYFGELTFTPVAGLLKFKPESWDMILGQKWIKAA